MAADFAFSDLLTEYLVDAGFTTGRLSRLSGVPRKTIQHWISGHVVSPSSPVDLLRLATTLRLTVLQTDALLHAAGHPALADLARLSGDPHVRNLLVFWHDALAHTIAPPPFQAIADLPALVGRDEEIRTLARVLRGHDYPGICCLSGMGGVGKTVLAAHLAYRLRPHFPDGVLWARVDVTPPLAILGAFAQAFDYDVHHTSDLHARSQLVRNLLAHKRVLIIFDNVRHLDEIEPLLPPSGSCRVLVTTRQHDLLIGAGGYHGEMTPFAPTTGHAQALFAQILGAERATREQAALTEIAELVGYLPLALAICASRLAHAPAWTATEFAVCLRAEHGRLSELAHGNRSVRATLTLSYAHLSPLQQRCLMAFAVCAGGNVDVKALATILGVPITMACATLNLLHGLSLAQPETPNRFRTHLLVKAYVLEQVIESTLWRAMATYFLAFLADSQYRYATIDQEFDNLLGAFAAALRYGLEAQYVRGVIQFSPYLRDRGHDDCVMAYLQQAAVLANIAGMIDERLHLYVEQGQLAEQEQHPEEAKRIWCMGLALARTCGNTAWVATMLIPLGGVVGKLGRTAEQEAYWQEAWTQIAALDDPLRASELLRQLGLRTVGCGHVRRATDLWSQALAFARVTGDPLQICRVLAHVSAALRHLGDWDAATAYAHEGIALARHHQLDWITAQMLGDLSIITSQQQDFASTTGHLIEGLALARASGYRAILGALLVTQSDITRMQGKYDQAERALIEAQELANHLRSTCLTCEVLYEQGELYLAHQQWEQAHAAWSAAWDIAYAQQLHVYLASIAYGRARLAAAQNDDTDACYWGTESLHRYQILEHYRAQEVAAWCADWAANHHTEQEGS